MPRPWTAAGLLKAKSEGAYIRHRETGETMDHRPRRKGDPKPWVARGSNGYRYASAECRPEARGGGPWSLARILRIPMN